MTADDYLAEVHRLSYALEAQRDEARLAHECSEATLAMAVARLGGTVEGAPTHRGNFLQRIDELRKVEKQWNALAGRLP